MRKKLKKSEQESSHRESDNQENIRFQLNSKGNYEKVIFLTNPEQKKMEHFLKSKYSSLSLFKS